MDGIYPCWTTFAPPVHSLASLDEVYYTKLQESLHKDIERDFRLLQARVQILRRESFLGYNKIFVNLSEVCLILHNMLVPMNQEDRFIEDSHAEGQGINLITEM